MYETAVAAQVLVQIPTSPGQDLPEVDWRHLDDVRTDLVADP
jgi:phage terminase Nu1 subunit (DNA packaging protein)